MEWTAPLPGEPRHRAEWQHHKVRAPSDFNPAGRSEAGEKACGGGYAANIISRSMEN
jgi:hypothetical protein